MHWQQISYSCLRMSKPEAANPHFKIYTSTVKQNPLYKKTKKSCRRNGSKDQNKRVAHWWWRAQGDAEMLPSALQTPYFILGYNYKWLAPFSHLKQTGSMLYFTHGLQIDMLEVCLQLEKEETSCFPDVSYTISDKKSACLQEKIHFQPQTYIRRDSPKRFKSSTCKVFQFQPKDKFHKTQKWNYLWIFGSTQNKRTVLCMATESEDTKMFICSQCVCPFLFPPWS